MRGDEPAISWSLTMARTLRVPRMRGDEPFGKAGHRKRVPRMRGDEPNRHWWLNREGVEFPACAGMNRSRNLSRPQLIAEFPACAGMNRLAYNRPAADQSWEFPACAGMNRH